MSEETAIQAANKISFKFWMKQKFKGKENRLPIYLPILDEEYEKLVNGSLN